MAEFLGALADIPPGVIIAATVFIVPIAYFARGLIMALGVVILGALALIMPNGALWIAGIIILGVVYMLTKSGFGSKSVTITAHKGGNVGDVHIKM